MSKIERRWYFKLTKDTNISLSMVNYEMFIVSKITIILL